MKPALYAVLFVTMSFFMTKTQAQKITIDELNDNMIIDSFDGGVKITLSYYQGNDLLLVFQKILKVSLVKVKGDNEKFIAIPVSTQRKAIEGADQYIIAKNKGFENDTLQLQVTGLVGKVKKTINAAIILAQDGNLGNEPPKIPACKAENLKRLNYSFIPAEIFAATRDSCPGYTCDTCPDNRNTVTYDFANNETYYGTGLRKEKKKMISVKVDDPIVFKIKNANPELYDVAISDSSVLKFQELKGIISLLSGANAIKAANGNISEVITESTGMDTCSLNADDSIGKALNDLAKDLSRFYSRLQELSPYYDAYCLRRLIEKTRDVIDQKLADNFGYLGISSVYDLSYYLKGNADNFQEGLGEKLEDVYHKILKVHYGYLYKVPHVDNVDAIDFLFSISPKNKNAALPEVRNGRARVYTRGGLKWDVSSGLYYAFNMQNEQYSIRSDSDIIARANGTMDSVINQRGILFRETKTGKGEFGFSSFLHFYPRLSPGFNVSGIVGAGVSFQDKPQIRYFAGLGFLLGRETRIALNAGGIFGNVNELSDQYTKGTNGVYNKLSIAEAGKDPVFKKHFIIRPFISLTYNLFFIKRKSDVVQTITATPSEDSKDEKAGEKTKDDTKKKQ
jgi:hypothetical protein